MREPSDFSSFHPAGAASSGGSGIEAAQVPLFSWRRSLPIDSTSPGIGPFGGTELRALATMNEALYAGNGYWRDSQQANPALPGAQVYVLDAPTASWRVDAEFNERVAPGGKRRYQAIGALFCARFAEARQSVLLASVWDRLGSLTIFAKAGRTGSWDRYRFAQTAPANAQTRSFGQHRDRVTGEELVFAGTNPLGIFSGTYDPGKPGGIDWGPYPGPGISPTEASQRVMSFAQCNAKLYATVGWQIYERQDGKTPSWKHELCAAEPPACQRPAAITHSRPGHPLRWRGARRCDPGTHRRAVGQRRQVAGGHGR
jgi:hypothetical protein